MAGQDSTFENMEQFEGGMESPNAAAIMDVVNMYNQQASSDLGNAVDSYAQRNHVQEQEKNSTKEKLSGPGFGEKLKKTAKRLAWASVLAPTVYGVVTGYPPLSLFSKIPEFSLDVFSKVGEGIKSLKDILTMPERKFGPGLFDIRIPGKGLDYLDKPKGAGSLGEYKVFEEGGAVFNSLRGLYKGLGREHPEEDAATMTKWFGQPFASILGTPDFIAGHTDYKSSGQWGTLFAGMGGLYALNKMKPLQRLNEYQAATAPERERRSAMNKERKELRTQYYDAVMKGDRASAEAIDKRMKQLPSKYKNFDQQATAVVS